MRDKLKGFNNHLFKLVEFNRNENIKLGVITSADDIDYIFYEISQKIIEAEKLYDRYKSSLKIDQPAKSE